MHPCRQPGTDVATARYGGEVVRAGQYPEVRERLDHAKVERGASYSAAGECEPEEIASCRVLPVPRGGELDGRRGVGGLGTRWRRFRACRLDLLEFFRQDAH